MEVHATSLEGVNVLIPRRFRDARGWFSETWNAERMREVGLDVGFVQDNHSYSARRGTLRGLHFQAPPKAQDKLVRCSRGAILDVAVDVRLGSPTYGKWATIELSAECGRQVLISKGFLHGFVTLVDDTEVQYKCSDLYAPELDGSVRWNSLGIDWRVDEPLMSEKDARAIAFDQFESPFAYRRDA